MSETAAAAGDATEPFVVFRLGDEQYGLPIAAVDEVVRHPDALTRMPQAPDFVAGLMNLRGRAVPVIDAARRFGSHPATVGTRGRRVVVVTVDGVQAGFAVDAVSAVLSVSRAALRPAPAFPGAQAGLFDRVAFRHGGSLILLVSARGLLQQAERDVLAAIAAAPA